MKSGYFPNHFTAAGFEPVRGGQAGCITGFHGGKPGEHVFKVFLGIDAEATAVFYNGIKDGALLSRCFVADEQPVLGSKLGRANGVFDQVVANLDPSVARIDFEVVPLVDGVANGFAEFALGKDAAAKGKLVDHSLESAMNDAALGGAHGLAHGGSGFAFPQSRFYMIEEGELVQDPGDESWRLFDGFEKFPPDVGVTAHEPDPLFVFGPGWIDDASVRIEFRGR